MRNFELKDMRKHPLVFIDLETTGLVPQLHEIIEIGYLIVDQVDLRMIKQNVIQIKPTHLETADQEALKIIHYHKRDWSAAIPLREALQQFSADVYGGIMVGQNITVDWSFIREALSQEDLPDPMHYHRIDIMSMAFALLRHEKQFKKFSLHEMTQFFGITIENAHAALDDVKATFEVYKKLLAYRETLEHVQKPPHG